MAKRRPGTELNHDNWEDEGEPEEKGSWTTASEAELSKRVIKTARRRNPLDKPATTSSSVFGGFSGFTASTPATTAAPSSIFAFLSQDKKKPEDEVDKKDDSPKMTTTSSTGPVDNNKEYHQKLRALNLSLCEWIKQHVDKDPVCILTPVFKDYERHLKDIEAATSKSTTGTNGTSSSATTTTTNNTAASPKTNTSSTTAPEAKPSPTAFKGFSFGSNPAPTTTNSSSLFGGNSSTGSLFGKPSSESTTAAAAPLVPSASTGFSFGGAKPFSFGNTGPVAATPAAKESEEAGDEDAEDEPPKVEFKPVVEEDSVYSKRCKVFFKIDGNFQERGIGTIFVKPVKESAKHQMIVRADTSLGNILVNVVLAKGLPVKKMGANNVMLVCIPNQDFDKPVSVLLKVKTAADADEVVEKLTSLSAE